MEESALEPVDAESHQCAASLPEYVAVDHKSFDFKKEKCYVTDDVPARVSPLVGDVVSLDDTLKPHGIRLRSEDGQVNQADDNAGEKLLPSFPVNLNNTPLNLPSDAVSENAPTSLNASLKDSSNTQPQVHEPASASELKYTSELHGLALGFPVQSAEAGSSSDQCVVEGKPQASVAQANIASNGHSYATAEPTVRPTADHSLPSIFEKTLLMPDSPHPVDNDHLSWPPVSNTSLVPGTADCDFDSSILAQSPIPAIRCPISVRPSVPLTIMSSRPVPAAVSQEQPSRIPCRLVESLPGSQSLPTLPVSEVKCELQSYSYASSNVADPGGSLRSSLSSPVGALGPTSTVGSPPSRLSTGFSSWNSSSWVPVPSSKRLPVSAARSLGAVTTQASTYAEEVNRAIACQTVVDDEAQHVFRSHGQATTASASKLDEGSRSLFSLSPK